MMKLKPYMLYCYNSNPDDATSTLYYLYMINDDTAFLFPQFKMLDVTDGEVLRILNSKTCKERVDNLRPDSEHPCDVLPCTIYQEDEYICLGLISLYRTFALYPEKLDMMKDVETRPIPRFTKGKVYKNRYTGKRYEYVSRNGLSWDELLFIDCITCDYAIFNKSSLEAFTMAESEGE